MTERNSAVSGSKVTESRSTFRGHIVDRQCILFVDATFRSGDIRYRVWKSRKKWAPEIIGAFVNRHHFQPTVLGKFGSDRMTGFSSTLTK